MMPRDPVTILLFAILSLLSGTIMGGIIPSLADSSPSNGYASSGLHGNNSGGTSNGQGDRVDTSYNAQTVDSNYAGTIITNNSHNYDNHKNDPAKHQSNILRQMLDKSYQTAAAKMQQLKQGGLDIPAEASNTFSLGYSQYILSVNSLDGNANAQNVKAYALDAMKLFKKTILILNQHESESATGSGNGSGVIGGSSTSLLVVNSTANINSSDSSLVLIDKVNSLTDRAAFIDDLGQQLESVAIKNNVMNVSFVDYQNSLHAANEYLARNNVTAASQQLTKCDQMLKGIHDKIQDNANKKREERASKFANQAILHLNDMIHRAKTLQLPQAVTDKFTDFTMLLQNMRNSSDIIQATDSESDLSKILILYDNNENSSGVHNNENSSGVQSYSMSNHTHLNTTSSEAQSVLSPDDRSNILAEIKNSTSQAILLQSIAQKINFTDSNKAINQSLTLLATAKSVIESKATISYDKLQIVQGDIEQAKSLLAEASDMINSYSTQQEDLLNGNISMLINEAEKIITNGKISSDSNIHNSTIAWVQEANTALTLLNNAQGLESSGDIVAAKGLIGDAFSHEQYGFQLRESAELSHVTLLANSLTGRASSQNDTAAMKMINNATESINNVKDLVSSIKAMDASGVASFVDDAEQAQALMNSASDNLAQASDLIQKVTSILTQASRLSAEADSLQASAFLHNNTNALSEISQARSLILSAKNYATQQGNIDQALTDLSNAQSHLNAASQLLSVIPQLLTVLPTL